MPILLGRQAISFRTSTVRQVFRSYTCATAPVSRLLRQSFRKVAQPVAILTAHEEGGIPRGITVSSLTTLSMDPPMVTFNVKTPSRALAAMDKSFVAHLVSYSETSVELAKRFASNEVHDSKWFEDESLWTREIGNIPVLHDKLETTKLYCDTEHMIEIGDHCIVIGRVTKVHLASNDKHQPLMYRDRTFLH